MKNGEDGHSQSKDKIIQIYSDFMMRIAKLEELMSMGSKFLVGFLQALGECVRMGLLVHLIGSAFFLGQPPILKTSALVEHIIKAHGLRRVLSYVEAGCVNTHDTVQNMSKSKIVVDELEHLLDDAASIVQTAKESEEDVNHSLDSYINSNDGEEVALSIPSKPEVADYATMMVVIYSMVKQDYTMQARIVSSLNLKSSSAELETYCHMWSLRPFIDDDIMHKAWSLVP